MSEIRNNFPGLYSIPISIGGEVNIRDDYEYYKAIANEGGGKVT